MQPGSDLPAARTTGPLPLEAALAQRQSRRSFASQPLTAAEAGQLLWSAQGENRAGGGRTAPSAGATYPLVLYLVAGRVEGLAAGVYRYAPQGHRLAAPAPGDARSAVAAAARGQAWAAEAPAIVVIAAEPSRTAARYGARAERYVAMEAGAAAQNLQSQAVALGRAPRWWAPSTTRRCERLCRWPLPSSRWRCWRWGAPLSGKRPAAARGAFSHLLR
ncbi:MAG: SagB/ThcOx family dehydrogenase [Betaproteobacteria bacterium]|nr:SagB/ThcOx family dehydrogenase [Betaproteobacteria bacterium]